MRPYDPPVCDEPVGGVAECPELQEALEAGDFRPGGDTFVVPVDTRGWVFEKAEDIGRYRLPGKLESYMYRVQRVTHPTDASRRELWHAFGEYCWRGRTASDADYIFLDGGGYFSNRAAALWAIHLWVAYLYKKEATVGKIAHGA
ncbi:MAG: hypothetical protein H7343_13925 [Undibacterium sp.]|nr:hypothetical protein [Opitutaceae bacterium]